MARYLMLAMFLLVGVGHANALNDPMRPPFFDGSDSNSIKRVSVSKPLTLSMILTAMDRKVAIVNGKSVQVGENIDGYRVLRIDNNRVVVSRKGKVKEIYLGKPQQQNKTQVDNKQLAVGD